MDAEFAELHRMLGRSGAALMCRVTIKVGGVPLVACIDTGATFSLMSDRAYKQVSEHLPGLLPAPVSLSLRSRRRVAGVTGGGVTVIQVGGGAL